MRKIRFLNSQNIDVLIIDESGSEYIKPCIPNCASFAILPVRNDLPFIPSFGFLFRLLFNIMNIKSLRYAFFFSIVESLKPKVIISFIDNSNDLGILHNQFPDKLTIAVQNGNRSGRKFPLCALSTYPVSVYYGFGFQVGELLKDSGINVKEYVSAGSLIYSLFKKQITIKHDHISGSLHYFNKELKTLNSREMETLVELLKGPSSHEKKYDICFISSYYDGYYYGQELEIEQQEKIFLILLKICKEYGFSLSVALRYESPSLSLRTSNLDTSSKNLNDEINYFSKMDAEGIAELIPNNYSFFGGYRLSSNSSVIVSVNSTLAFEMFGAGKKTLFGASADNFSLAKLWDSLGNYNKFPDMNLLDDFNKESMCKKINFLLKIDNNDYLDKTKNARMHYMNNIDEKSADELIKNRINDLLLKV